MEEDSEVLDWGNEDDEVQVAESNRASVQQNGQDDAEDAVSLGGDEDDEIYPYRPVSHEDPSKARQGTPHASQSSQPHAAGKQEYQGENSAASQKPLSRQSDSSGLRRSQSLGQMTHALPPKPNFAPPPSPRPTPVTTSTLASAMVFRDKRSNGHGKNVSGSRDRGSGLPPDWEERYPRGGGRGPYYYNVKTHESTWSRPLVADSGPSSPAKERDVDTVRRPLDLSPRRNVPDDVSRSPHKEAKRPVSPGGPLSFDDRHYRPGSAALNGSSTAEVGLQPQGLGVGLPPRPVSPKVPERRRDARSVTPPPARRHARSLERPSRTRRDVSPPPMERGVPARDRVDVRRSPVLERAWDRPRDGYPQDETRGREYANERGRRPRDDPVSEHTRNGQDARESYPTWSAPRPRSPPLHLRDSTPPRRYQEQEAESHQKSRYGRAPSPHERARALEPHSSSDSIPQRRARDYDLDVEIDAKRRRMDDEYSRRRPSSLERAPPSPLLDRSLSQAAAIENARRRVPLPSQTDRFRQLAKTRPDAPPALPPQSSQYPTPRQTDSYPVGRGTSTYDIPSAPRGHNIPPPGREYDSDRSGRAPAGRHVEYSSSRSRFDEPATFRDDRDAMDVDFTPHVPRSMHPRSDIPPRPRVSSVSDRAPIEPQMDAIPKGPRAMSRSGGSFSTNTPPLQSPVIQSMPIRMPDPASAAGRNARHPPPHFRPEPTMGARGPPPQLSAPPSGPRGFSEAVDIDRRSGRPQGYDHARNYDHPPQTSRREPVPPVNLKLSGTNNIPIGPKRTTPGAPSPAEPFSRSPDFDRVPAKFAEPLRAPSRTTYEPESGYQDRLAPEGSARRASMSGHGSSAGGPPSPQVNVPIPHSLPPRPRDEPPPVLGHRAGRPSRFGPEITPSQPAEQPRIWLTREESMGSVPTQDVTKRSWRTDDGRAEPSARYNYNPERHPPPRDDYDRYDRRAEPPAPPQGRTRYPEDVHPTDRHRVADAHPALDRRLSAFEQPTEPAARPPSGRDWDRKEAYYTEPRVAPQDAWGMRAYRDDREPPAWERSTDEFSDRRAGGHHPRGRASPSPPPPRAAARYDPPSAHGRRDRLPDIHLSDDVSHGGSAYPDPAGSDPTRPPARRGGSLLERLTLDDPPAAEAVAPQPSLRERVEAPVKRTLPEVSGLPPRPSAEAVYDAEMAALESLESGRGRGKRGRGKRGRRL